MKRRKFTRHSIRIVVMHLYKIIFDFEITTHWITSHLRKFNDLLTLIQRKILIIRYLLPHRLQQPIQTRYWLNKHESFLRYHHRDHRVNCCHRKQHLHHIHTSTNDERDLDLLDRPMFCAEIEKCSFFFTQQMSYGNGMSSLTDFTRNFMDFAMISRF